VTQRNADEGARAPDSSFVAQVTFVYTADLAASEHFYGEVLGLPLALDQGSCKIYRVSPGAQVGVCLRPDAEPPQGVILTLVTDDVDGWCRRIEAYGVSLEKAPTFDAQYKIYHCFLRDPSGALVEIQRFEDQAWKP